MYKPLVIIVPTRNRPKNVAKVLLAWKETRGFDYADLVFAYDEDDPNLELYREAIIGSGANGFCMPRWEPMVHKLNFVAVKQAQMQWREAVGFAGDDHLPRSPNWSKQYLDQLQQMKTGIVYGNDLWQAKGLPTEWAMTKDIINTLGRMVPAPVEHLYCDNSILELGTAAHCIQYMPTVVIEHMHPLWKKGEWDQQYRDVNSRKQYGRDGQSFEQWKRDQMWEDAHKIRELRRGHDAESGTGTQLDVQAST
jgi:hypothetical protein